MSKQRSSKASTSGQKPRKSGGKAIVIILGGVIAAAALAFVLGGGDEPVPAAATGSLEDMAARHVRGAANATVTLIEFGDFQCPACAAYHPVLKALLERFPDDLELQFHHFPLVSIHPNALPAGVAAEAAAEQGRFWEMNDMLFENQNAWAFLPNPDPVFVEYARALALDIDRFESDLRSDELQTRVLADGRMANQMGLGGTPSFFVNGRQLLALPSSLAEFERIITDAIPNP